MYKFLQLNKVTRQYQQKYKNEEPPWVQQFSILAFGFPTLNWKNDSIKINDVSITLTLT